jgi:ribosomal protein S18 acetylase RimI-like enzyme
LVPDPPDFREILIAMPDPHLIVRAATAADLSAVGVLGARLVRVHHAFDARRFMNPGGNLERGYAHFLGSQLERDDAAVFVAEVDGAVGGYIYLSIEPVSWEELRDEAGFIHDVIVDEAMGGRGIATQLIDAGITWLRERGMPRVVLHTADQNIVAQRLFAKLGFRRTMIEMTLEINPL